jgi:hypothetical protein
MPIARRARAIDDKESAAVRLAPCAAEDLGRIILTIGRIIGSRIPLDFARGKPDPGCRPDYPSKPIGK